MIWKPILSVIVAVLSVAPAEATVICWDGHTLACDSQTTHGSLKHFGRIKIAKVNGHLVGCAGLVTQNIAFIKWFADQKQPFPEFKESEALVIRPDGTAWHYAGECCPTERPALCAIGSGEPYALGAMHHGASAEEAVKIAEGLDIYCGGQINTLTLDNSQ